MPIHARIAGVLLCTALAALTGFVLEPGVFDYISGDST
jgi:hypothetical protein